MSFSTVDPQENFENKASSSQSVLSVEQLNVAIKRMLEGQLPTVWVQGEISNFKAHSSGHYYFSLKDKKSQVSAVMFRGYNSKLKFALEDGMEVIVRGRISVYEPRGTYQILCESMEPVGAGALQKAFEQLKTKLKAEGLFDAARKKAIPHFPQRIAVVTSPTGAAIQDILNIMSRRAAHVEVIVVPTIVQGADAAPKICEAFMKAQQIRDLDVIILGRGGGSMEDMWCFNDEALARLIAASSVPVISAVGHEIDFTICDFVADLRAPTPSAAAELVARSSVEIVKQIRDVKKYIQLAMGQLIQNNRNRVTFLHSRLSDPKKKLEDSKLRNDDLLNRLEFATQRLFEKKLHRVQMKRGQLVSPRVLVQQSQQKVIYADRKLKTSMNDLLLEASSRLKNQMKLLDTISPLRVVDRGFSILQKDQVVVKSYRQLNPGDAVTARLSDGIIELEYKKLLTDLKGP